MESYYGFNFEGNSPRFVHFFAICGSIEKEKEGLFGTPPPTFRSGPL